ncbi:serine/threonine-protein kinase [Streptomyces sp. KR80]|uniref:serine/threonine-protein kinase n=1 Tax=Streptomyces sp. KR80 TaxID=3457426 RepID=UPI003FD51509
MGSFGREGDRLIAGRYRLGARLGRGGMGTVWRATDELLGRQVAVKELHMGDDPADDDARMKRERTLREARTVAQLRHPGVIVVHDVVEQDERPWLVMELIDGRSLADRLGADGPVQPREAARIGLALLGALRAAHAHGVLHRDVKPANVLMDERSGRVVLTDFGIAQISGGTTITETGSFVGSPEYTAPERMSGGRAGPESDLWSLGALLCAALSGKSPFHRDSLGGVLHAVVSDEIRPPEAAQPLLPLVTGLLERDPERRLAAAEAERLLGEYLRTGRMPALPAAGHAPTQRGIQGPWSVGGRPPVGGPGDERPRSGVTRARTIVAATLLVASAGAAGVAGVALLVDGEGEGGSGGPGPTATAGKTGRPTSRPPSVSPTVTVTSTETETTVLPTPRPPGRTPPAGYRTASDPAGFRIAVPDGFTRSFEPPRIFYYSPGKVIRLGVQIQDAEPGGPLSVMRAAHSEGPSRYTGYRDGEVTAATRGGNRAALWEFTWNGFTADGGPRHTFDFSWEEDGKLYDVWVSAPVGKLAAARRHFDTALETFVRTRPHS